MDPSHKILIKSFKISPDAFWKDAILIQNANSIRGNTGFNIKSIENDFKAISQPTNGKVWYHSSKIPAYINHLEVCGYIQKSTKGDFYCITPKGLSLVNDEGGNLEIAKRKLKEKRRFDFEYFKLGYDTLISLLALLLSIAALLISLER